MVVTVKQYNEAMTYIKRVIPLHVLSKAWNISTNTDSVDSIDTIKRWVNSQILGPDGTAVIRSGRFEAWCVSLVSVVKTLPTYPSSAAQTSNKLTYKNSTSVIIPDDTTVVVLMNSLGCLVEAIMCNYNHDIVAPPLATAESLLAYYYRSPSTFTKDQHEIAKDIYIQLYDLV